MDQIDEAASPGTGGPRLGGGDARCDVGKIRPDKGADHADECAVLGGPFAEARKAANSMRDRLPPGGTFGSWKTHTSVGSPLPQKYQWSSFDL
ncbi:hypothetical protein [Methylobacterium sp. J-092]|uniref:hypothetical protein n=1 Tax=Methylobacterium sp. J-092 TaxID=2836667 RepID=UPI001FB9CCB2|nr:hypothetical protein [Methylobacterium sp. J-092]MCJ2008759.1 hypothetical protein [Methylobacterium sp. J-092]